jgi:WXG100 family type VII secretion target
MLERSTVTLADLTNTAAEVRRLDDLTQNELQKLKTDVASLRENYDSVRSAGAFDEAMLRWDRDAAAMRDALQEIARRMSSTEGAYDGLETGNAAAVNRIQDGPSYNIRA